MLEVAGLEVRYGSTTAVDDVSFAVARGEVLSVLGPSGSGKSTLLRAIAGLEVPAAGRVRWDGVDVTALPPHRRRFGFLFQDLALFPHRDVFGNVAFGLRMQGASTAATRVRVEEVLELVGLGGFARRAVSTLSGGELQRVAIARALAPSPALLLLDEPLSSLDRVLRDRLIEELAALLRELDVAAVYVTHDQQEAFALGGRVAVLRDGRIVQLGEPEQLWRRPADLFVARFLGFANLLPKGEGFLVVPPDAISISPAGDLGGIVRELVFRGDHFVATVVLDDGAALQVPTRAGAVQVGEAVRLAIDPALVSTVGQGDRGTKR